MSWITPPAFIKSVFVLISCLIIINFRDCMRRVVSYKTGKSLADSWKAAFFESSAKENSVSYVPVTLALPLFLAASSKNTRNNNLWYAGITLNQMHSDFNRRHKVSLHPSRLVSNKLMRVKFPP